MVFIIKKKFIVIVIGSIIPVKKITEIRLIIKMFAYSAIKIIANRAPLYSTLNPDTSSDSPSAKSKGVRFVSARLVMNHVVNNGIIINLIHDIEFIVVEVISICLITTNALSKIRDMVTS
jgi:hypothetical protein